MKKIVTSLIVLCLTTNLVAQVENSQVENSQDKSEQEIGIVVTDLINGSFQFRYERLVGKHISVALSVGYKGKEGLINLSGLDTEHIQTNDLTYSGLKIIPEVRYYINKTQIGSMDGFYFGAYIKHTNFKSDLDGTYINDENENFDIEFDAKLRVTSVGFMAGYKYRVSNRLSLDFLIAGPGAGFHSYSITKQQSLPDEFYTDLNEALSNYSIFDLIDSDFRFKANDVKTKFSTISFRYGITLGYSF
ncbi:MAG: DUF3575 domain-containing protein [Aureibaculum sp.]|nr:DUF3575 domain-containing protein [Aureibaculum sp.]